jgi:hypothetical protein
MLLLAAKGKMIACSSKCILTYTAVDDNLDILRGDQDIVHQAARDLGKSFRCEDSVESFFSEREEADAEADTACTHKHRHPPAPCEQGFLPENIACLSV